LFIALIFRVVQPTASIEESSRFLKKAAQKLLLCWAMGCVSDNAHDPASQSFFASFCSQKEAFLLACPI
jgi:hypothetical protein